MKTLRKNDKKSLGYKGEAFIIDKLKTKGFSLYKRNVTYINAEIDIVMYKYNPLKYSLDIRVIEVKTRTCYEFDLLNLGLVQKWLSVKRYMFEIKSEIDTMFEVLNYSEVHFDLALVRARDETLFLYSYIKDANLML